MTGRAVILYEGERLTGTVLPDGTAVVDADGGIWAGARLCKGSYAVELPPVGPGPRELYRRAAERRTALRSTIAGKYRGPAV